MRPSCATVSILGQTSDNTKLTCLVFTLLTLTALILRHFLRNHHAYAFQPEATGAAGAGEGSHTSPTPGYSGGGGETRILGIPYLRS
jgi:hypothetical protein